MPRSETLMRDIGWKPDCQGAGGDAWAGLQHGGQQGNDGNVKAVKDGT